MFLEDVHLPLHFWFLLPDDYSSVPFKQTPPALSLNRLSISKIAIIEYEITGYTYRMRVFAPPGGGGELGRAGDVGEDYLN